MRVVFEEDVRALLCARERDGAGAPLTCLLDLRLPPPCELVADHAPERRAALSGAAVRGLAAFAMRAAETRRAGWLDLAFFGGEPLRELEAMAALSRSVQRACLTAGIGYGAHVLTSGRGFDRAVARRLAGAGMTRVQVTLRAPRRGAAAARAAGRWRDLLDGVVEASGEVAVVLRVTLEPSCDLEALVEALEERALVDARAGVALYLARAASLPQQARELVALSSLLAVEGPRPALRQ